MTMERQKKILTTQERTVTKWVIEASIAFMQFEVCTMIIKIGSYLVYTTTVTYFKDLL